MACSVTAAGTASLIISRGLVATMLAPILFLALSKNTTTCGRVGASSFFFLLLVALAITWVAAATMGPICTGDLTFAAVVFSSVLNYSVFTSSLTCCIVFATVVVSVVQLHAYNEEAGKREVQTEIDRRELRRGKKKNKTAETAMTETFPPARFMATPHQEGVEFVHQIFERSCDRFPNSPALKIAGEFGVCLTYQKLDERANQIAWSLEDYVFAKDTVIAVLLDREADLFAAHLGILKAGAAVLMIDPVLPTSTVEHMIKDANVAAVVTRLSSINCEHLKVIHATLGQHSLVDTAALLNTSATRKRRTSIQWLTCDASQILSNVIYTSGTTGNPKGVALCHAGYVNHHISAADEFSLVHGVDAASTAASAAFDASLEEWYVAWMSGCPLVSLSYEQVRLGPDLPQLLIDEGVTWFQGTPSLLRTMGNPQDIPMPICRIVDAGGERLPEDIVSGWTENGRRLINTYGPTETSIVVSRSWVTPGNPVAIGTPVPGTTLVVLDENYKSVGPGVAGELCVGGIQLAREYLNRLELTSQKFIHHPKFGRLYTTGDLCRLGGPTEKDGQQYDASAFYCIGRMDGQVKVRGHRVELASIDAMVCQHLHRVQDAAVVFRRERMILFVHMVDGDSANLNLLVQTNNSHCMVETEVKEQWTVQLKKFLPKYALPDEMYYISGIPKHPISQKLLRRNLPDPERENEHVDVKTAETKTEFKSTEHKRLGVSIEHGPLIDEALTENTQHQHGVHFIHEIFERTVDRFPKKIALQWNEVSVTYQSLDARAEKIRASIAPHIKGPNQVVILMLERSIDMYAVYLAIMKAGAAVCTIDVDKCPVDIATYIFNDVAPAAVVTSHTLKTKKPWTATLLEHASLIPVVDVDYLDCHEEKKSQERKKQGTLIKRVGRPSWLVDSAQCLSNIVYTSGTTGWPKGVMSPHSAYVNFHTNIAARLSTTSNDGVAQFASLAFDISQRDMFLAWTVGAKLISVPSGIMGKELCDLIIQNKVSVLNCVPSLLRTLPANELRSTVRVIYTAGEPLTPEVASPFASFALVFNGFGCSETPMSATVRSVSSSTAITLSDGDGTNVGHPVNGVFYAVVDYDTHEPLPVGDIGEILIGGAQIAKGYRGNTLLSEKKFVLRPKIGKGRIFTTGDSGKMNNDGSLMFLGRRDDQVQLKGNRVELAAVDAQITRVLQKNTMVKVQGNVLVAFVVWPLRVNSNADWTKLNKTERAKYREQLRAALPSYSVPSLYIAIREIPKTKQSGKSMRKDLPDISILDSSSTTELESKCSNAMDTTDALEMLVLGIARQISGVHDAQVLDPFYEYFESISASQFVATLRRKNGDTVSLDCAMVTLVTNTLTIAQLFTSTQCVRAIADWMKTQAANDVADHVIVDFDNFGHVDETKKNLDLWVAGILEKITNTNFPIQTKDTSFGDLVNSISAAEFLGKLRRYNNATTVDGHRIKTNHLTMRDLFTQYSTLRKLSAAVQESCVEIGSSNDTSNIDEDDDDDQHHRTSFESAPRFQETSLCGGAYGFTCVQMLTVLSMLVGTAALLSVGVVFVVSIPFVREHWVHMNLWELFFVIIGVSTVLGMVLTVLLVLPVMLLSRFVLGGSKPGVYPLWSKTHYCVWLLSKIQAPIISAAVATRNDGLTSSVLRLFGADIGNDVHWDADGVKIGVATHLLKVGDTSSISNGTIVDTVQYRSGCIVIGPVKIGDNSFVGARAYLGPFTDIGEGAEVSPLCMVQFDTVNDRERYYGVPGKCIGRVEPLPHVLKERRDAALQPYRWSPRYHRFIEWILELFIKVVAICAMVPFCVLFYPGLSAVTSTSVVASEFSYLLVWMPFFIYYRIVSSFVNATLACFWLRVLGTVKPGVYPAAGWTSTVVNIKLHLFAMLFSEFGGGCMYSYWMALAGVTLEGGYSNNEASRVYGMLPDTTCIGKNSFWGFGSYSTAVSFRDDCMHIGISRFPEQCFLGNKAVLGAGNYPTDCLIGVGTYIPEHALRRNMNSQRDSPTTVFGLPMFNMPLRDSQNSDLDINDSPFIPTLFQYVQRFVMYDVAFKVLQGAVICFVFAALRTTIATAALLTTSGHILTGAFFTTFTVFSVLSIVVPLCLVVTIVTMKRVLQLGYRTTPGSYSFWSYDAQVIHFLWYFPDMFLAPMNALVGNTLLANSLIWRPMGARIGNKTLLMDHHATDVDLINIGSECVSTHPQFQLHSYEERLLRIGTTRVGDRVTLIGVQLMANSNVGNESTVLANSVVMKAQELLAGETYAGVPARELLKPTLQSKVNDALRRRRRNRRQQQIEIQIGNEVQVEGPVEKDREVEKITVEADTAPHSESAMSTSRSEEIASRTQGSTATRSAEKGSNDAEANEDTKSNSPLLVAYEKIAAGIAWFKKKNDVDIYMYKKSPSLSPRHSASKAGELKDGFMEEYMSPTLSPRYSASSADQLMDALMEDNFTLSSFSLKNQDLDHK